MVRGVGCALLLIVLAGCYGPDKAEFAELRPIGSSDFEYRVKTGLFYSARSDGPDEGIRLAWLEADMRSSQFCGDRWELVSREVVFEYQDPDGHPIDQILYRGRCRA